MYVYYHHSYTIHYYSLYSHSFLVYSLQIIIFIGFFEWFSEAAGTHYMRGGTPGDYPKFTDYPELLPHPVPFNLFDPFGFSANRSEEAQGRWTD